jgi:hypothetical protein
LKAKDETGTEKSGSYFSDSEPQIDESYDVEEKFNEQYNNFSWFVKKDKKQGFVQKPGLSIDQQIRAIALQEAVKHSSGMSTKSNEVVKVAAYFETYIKEGKI